MLTSYNPATGSIVWQGKEADANEVRLAIEQALAAYQSWKNKSFEERAAYCKRYAAILTQKKELLARTISEEMGKPFWESLTEVQAMINKVDISIAAYNERCTDKIVQTGSATLATRFHPHGVVAVLGPFNFPGHLPNGHIVPALLAGNTILFKPSEKTPKVGQMMCELWTESGLPDGVLTLLQGARTTAQAMLSHREVTGVFFTGSVAAGRAIQEQSFAFPGRILALEMGGNNPLIISKVSDIPAVVYLIIQSAFITSGQRCSCARRLIITDDKILAPLLAATKKLAIGAYTDSPEPFMGPVVSPEAADHLLAGYNNLVAKGGKALSAFERKNASFVTPGIVDMTGCSMNDEELFGPILQVVRVKNLKEAIHEANNTSFGLVAGLVSDSYEEYQQFYNQIRAGVVNWNMPTTGASSQAPFGGVGCSGNYRPSGYFAADYSAYPVASQEAKALELPAKLLPGVTL